MASFSLLVDTNTFEGMSLVDTEVIITPIPDIWVWSSEVIYAGKIGRRTNPEGLATFTLESFPELSCPVDWVGCTAVAVATPHQDSCYLCLN